LESTQADNDNMQNAAAAARTI